MEHHKSMTLLQVMNRRFRAGLSGRTNSIAQTLGMSDQELAEAERRGFTEEEARLVKEAVQAAGFEFGGAGNRVEY
jgi:hypothetical protein